MIVPYGVNYLAHLTGAALGIAVGLALLLTGWVDSEYYEENLLQVLGVQEKHNKPVSGIQKRRSKRI